MHRACNRDKVRMIVSTYHVCFALIMTTVCKLNHWLKPKVLPKTLCVVLENSFVHDASILFHVHMLTKVIVVAVTVFKCKVMYNSVFDEASNNNGL